MDWPPQIPDFHRGIILTEQKTVNMQNKALNIIQEARKTIPEDYLMTMTS